jgi:hypothetical protein
VAGHRTCVALTAVRCCIPDLLGRRPEGRGGVSEVVEENGALVGCVSSEDFGDLTSGRPDYALNTAEGVRYRLDDDLASIIRIGSAVDESGSLQAVD